MIPPPKVNRPSTPPLRAACRASRGGDATASILWTADIPAAGTVALRVDGGDIYVGAADEARALAAEDGSPLWTWGAPDTVVALATGDGAPLMVMTLTTLSAVDAATGEGLWTVDLLDLGGVADEAVAALGDSVVLGGDPLRVLDAADGAVLAERVTGSVEVSAVRIDGEVAYAALADGVGAYTLDGLQPVSGFPVATSDAVDGLIVGPDLLFYSVFGGGVGALTPAGAPIFEDQPGELFDALAQGAGGELLAARADGVLQAWSEQGDALWTVEDGGSPVRDLAVVGQTVFYSSGAFLDGINLSDGSALWNLSPEDPAVAVEGL